MPSENHSEEDQNDSDGEIPYIPTSDASGQSRLYTEFEILKGIGKGGFGDVIKVGICNKLVYIKYLILQNITSTLIFMYITFVS